MTLTEGTMVTSTVRLVRLLGEGGMGSVWVADHLRLDSQVAVKFIDPYLIKQHPSIRSRFRREASAAAQIKSPHVVRTFDHGEMEDGTPFIVMELLEGESLGDRLHRAGTLGVQQLDQVLSQAAKALSKAHKIGVVHRDIKPDNLFLVDSGADSDEEPYLDELFVKILDFGIAKQTQRDGGSVVTMAGTTIGTPDYMSPEQILSAKDVDHHADMWALAVVAYQALTGTRPFSGETLGAVFQSICAAEFTLPSDHPGGPPPEIDAWFLRALAQHPEDRFGSVREMAVAFSRIARGLPEGSEVFDEDSTEGLDLPPRPPVAAISNAKTTPALDGPDAVKTRVVADTAPTRLEGPAKPDPVPDSGGDPNQKTFAGATTERPATAAGAQRPGMRRAMVGVAAAVLVTAVGIGAVMAVRGGEPGSGAATTSTAATAMAPVEGSAPTAPSVVPAPSTDPAASSASAPDPSGTTAAAGAPPVSAAASASATAAPEVTTRPRPAAVPAAPPAPRPKPGPQPKIRVDRDNPYQ